MIVMEMLTTAQAARRFGVPETTLRWHVRRAVAAGDERVLRVGKAWAAPADWWQEIITAPTSGKPPRATARKAETPAEQ